ncbi:MAG: RNA-binding protein [Dokdonella sp.]|jgi:ribosome-associated heat shock protein Hsp15|uniref:RNA-binding S4 domain-containing protein n=1 Tax=Dokdonella sp. TaxID=2291710 RepID=UPI001B695A5E|nr:S4 domain-containing protein [Dokdonella sp.]MCC6439899.1 RNA-binding protein [Rhodanobacteraceae bacterium]MBK8122431.1 RNA-binding protein [Dokdonella sp.]MBP6330477.1 RNA-binding protein [Dokdonella sp.]HNV06916.1 S4 domain-containing protein [Dokdonella sp.]HPW03752.1 S4 domain-containing protein [Dokdonella sp.]
MASETTEVRLDVWLWAARLFKTRSLAKQAIVGGKIAVNDQAAKPARTLHAGDLVQVVRGWERMTVEVIGLNVIRGPATQAVLMYRELAESQRARELEREQRRLTAAGIQLPASHLDKHARKLRREIKRGTA